MRLKNELDYNAITVRAVAAEAGVSVGTFYAHFESIAELAQATWQEPVDNLRKKIERLARRTEDPLERIQKVLECYARFEKDQPAAFQSAFLFVRQPFMTEPDKVKLDTESFFIILREAIREGQALDKIRDGDPAEMAQLLWASVHGAMSLPYHLDRYNFMPSQKFAKRTVRFLVDSLATDN